MQLRKVQLKRHVQMRQYLECGAGNVKELLHSASFHHLHHIQTLFDLDQDYIFQLATSEWTYQPQQQFHLLHDPLLSKILFQPHSYQVQQFDHQTHDQELPGN